jgi:hypothetical protein
MLATLATLLADPSTRQAILDSVPPQWVATISIVLTGLGIFLHRLGVNHNPDGGPVAAPYHKETGQTVLRSRRDRHRNPLLITTDEAMAAGLKYGVDYLYGDPFEVYEQGCTVLRYTALFLGDPIQTTLRVVDRIGWQDSNGHARWGISVSPVWWSTQTTAAKVDLIRQVYGQGELSGLFDAYLSIAQQKTDGVR